MSAPLVLRNVEVGGRSNLDVRLENGRVVEIGRGLACAMDEIDGGGGALLPGLVDHHIHLFALAAEAQSVDLRDVKSAQQFEARLTAALAQRPPGAWVRAVGYHEAMAGDLTARDLDGLAPHHRLRIQHQTGALWVLNSLALETVGDADEPANVERDERGRRTGRIWRADAWLRERIGPQAPDLASCGRRLASYGVTAVTDASVTTEVNAAARLAAAHRHGELPQRLTLMSAGELQAPADRAFDVGPVKLILDDADLPDIDTFAHRVRQAHFWSRAAAVHCVTAGELALALAGFEAAGARAGDRIEHGGVIPEDAIAEIGALGLTIVTQPGFIYERGDRYAQSVAAADLGDLYRCASLRARGVRVAASTDAPYSSPDPWVAMAAAIDRRTKGGRILGPDERVSAASAVAMWLSGPLAPGARPRSVRRGAAADLCLLSAPLREVLRSPSAQFVRATFIGGRRV